MQTMTSRNDGRKIDELRPYSFERNFIKTAEGSVLVSCGDTKVIVTAKPEDRIPPFLKEAGTGWVTAEYAMLPGSCADRTRRDKNSRASEIQRLIGRSARAMVSMDKMPPVTITIDCDVIQADGGTRTASISGAYIALKDCLEYLKKEAGYFQEGLPLINQIAAVSVGIVDGQPLLDLNYIEDSTADTDANFVLCGSGKIIEIQGTAEKEAFSKDELDAMFSLAQKGVVDLCNLQNKALNN